MGPTATMKIGFETTYGTFPAAGNWHEVPFFSFDPGFDGPFVDDPLAGEGAEAQDVCFDPEIVQPTLVVPLDLRNFGWWLRALLGDATVVDNLDGTFSHTFKSGGELITGLAIEVGHTKLAAPEFDMHTGFKPGSLSIDMSREGKGRATITGQAQALGSSGATVDAAAATLAQLPFQNKRGAIRVAAAQDGKVTGGSFEFNHGLEPEETIRGDGLIEDLDYVRQVATGTVQARYTGATALVTAMTGETPAVLDHRFTLPNALPFELRFDFPRIFVSKTGKPIDGPGGVSINHPWQASGADGAKQLMEVELRNDVAVYS